MLVKVGNAGLDVGVDDRLESNLGDELVAEARFKEMVQELDCVMP